MNKGFTLIELSAVLVILAILALITTPLVISIIKDSKKTTLEFTAEKYVDVLQQEILKQNMAAGEEFEPTICEIKVDGNVLCDGNVTLQINVEGNKPDGGIVKFSKGVITSLEITYETKIFRMNEEGKLVQEKDLDKHSTAEIIYFDVLNGTTCEKTDYNNSNSNTGYNGIDNAEGDQNSCLKFYVLGDNGDDTSSLILDHNTTEVVTWNSSGSNTGGPVEVLDKLKESTKDWKGTITPPNYSKDSYVINYSSYKARLVTAEEIATLVGNTSWNETAKSNHYYLESQSQTPKETCTSGNTSECKYGWIYDRTSINCKTNGCSNNSNGEMYGFWTATSKTVLSTAAEHVEMCNGSLSYGISYLGRIGYACVNNVEHYGVRPVIIVSNDNI